MTNIINYLIKLLY